MPDLDTIQFPQSIAPEREREQDPQSSTLFSDMGASAGELRHGPQSYPSDPNVAYTVDRDDNFRAVNAPAGEKVYFFNGMLMEPESTYKAAVAAREVFGRDIEVIPNATESFHQDLLNCVHAAFSTTRGLAAEPFATGQGVEILHSKLLGEDEKVIIIDYSQGNLIFKNVLEKFQQEIEQEAKTLSPQNAKALRTEAEKLLSERMIIRRYGSPYSLAPAGVKSIESQHPLDGVGMLGKALTAKDALMMTLQGKEYSRAERTVSKPRGFMSLGERHDFTNHYMPNNALFFVAANRERTPEAQAQTLYNSVKESEFSQPEYDKIISQFIAPADMANGLLDSINNRMSHEEVSRFAERLLKLAPNGQIGKNQFSKESMDKLQNPDSYISKKEPAQGKTYSRHPSLNRWKR